jgi:hypothetical protein
MLERLPIPDVLALLLDVRSAALSEIFGRAQGLDSLRRQLDDHKSALANRDIDETVLRVEDAISLLTKTIDRVHTIFGSSENSQGSMLLTLLEEIQADATVGNPLVNVPASSAALYRSPSQSSATLAHKPPSSLGSILPTLPNAHLLLRYLPSQITSFTPFIDTSSARNELPSSTVNDRVDAWFDRDLQILLDSFRDILNQLKSARQVARVRDSVQGCLDQSGSASPEHVRDRLRSALREAMQRRLRDMYNEQLDQLVGLLSDTLTDACKELPESKEGKSSYTRPFILFFPAQN